MMKTKAIFLISILLITNLVFAQSDNETERNIEPFNTLIVGGYYTINLHNGAPKIIIHAKESLATKVITEVRNEVLHISNKPFHSSNPIKIDLYSNFIEDFDISGAVLIQSDEIQTLPKIRFNISGAANVSLTVETEEIIANVSGAGILDIKGNTKSINGKAKGAAIIRAADLSSDKSNLTVIGSAGALISDDSEDILSTDTDVDINRENELSAKDSDDEKTTYGVTYDGNTARAKFLGIRVDVDEDEETGEVRVGTHKWVYDSEGEVTHKRVRRNKFNGHWGGFGLGINGYVNDKFVYELPEEYEFLDLLWQKSVNVDINIWEQNIQIANDGSFGLVTGIGYSIYNYRFTKSFTIMQDSNYFSGLYNHGVNVRKSKIVTNYITVPILFEYQDKNPSPLTKYRWHVNLGVILGVRVHTHQKTYFNETNKKYELVNPITNNIDAYAYSPAGPISKVHNDFYISPFKADASLRVGWGWINLYANVSLTQMFNVGKGPKLYPFSVGIMLVSW